MASRDPELSILFVCLGNICRSPTGEGVFQNLVDERGLADRIRVDSAGTAAYHVGERADRRMRRAAETRGYDLASRARQATVDDFDEFDLVIAMDRENRSDLAALAGGDGAPDNLRLLSEYLPDGSPSDVPDPYYGGPEGFERVLDLLEEAAPAILDDLLSRGPRSDR